ncbi:GUN4 domain-containing protein [Phormidium tenue FACHB-886]|nr:GUN4 domain-containing protein [Phormidium tenue FACHB-886]
MRQALAIGFLAMVMTGSGVPLAALPSQADGVLSSNPAPSSPVTNSPAVDSPSADSSSDDTNAILASRDAFYFSSRGFRFVLPSSYTLEDATESIAGQANAPLQLLQLWQQKDFVNRENLPESPPLIRIYIYDNSQQLPLTDWKDELSRADDRAVTVAGQPGIAYSATGLYDSDNVLFKSLDDRYVVRIQGGYLDRNDEILQTFQVVVQSFSFDILPSATASPRINYSRLQSLLENHSWQAADVETRGILQRLADGKDYLYSSATWLNEIPCEDLETIDTLWSEASDGRFGYAAQRRLWQQTSGSANSRVEQFGQQVGWRAQPSASGTELFETGWKSDIELVPTAEAPIGQFPWVGVSSSALTDFLNTPGCGSCTIDMLYLKGDRFYHYLPALFTKLESCANPTAAQK